MIIERLLRDLEPDTYCLISSRNYENNDQPNYSRKLPGKYYHLQTFQLTRGWRLGLQFVRAWINLVVGTVLRGIAIARIVRREKCDAIMVCTGGSEALDMPAAFLASRLTGTRFYAYLLDQYIHMVSHALGISLMNWVEPLMIKKAAAVIAHNEFLRDELRRRHQVEAVVIHNPCELPEYERARSNKEISPAVAKSEFQILYTGNLSILQYSAIRNLIVAIELLKRDDIKLHIYTAQAPADAEREGLRGPVVFHEHEPVSAMPAIQQQSDLLFLPLAINSAYPEIVRTAAPGKMGEYLAARRPILVQAPADSFIAWYFRQHQCGLVVDKNDPAQLAGAISSILSDPGLRERLSARAWERAKVDFDLNKARAQFAELMGLKNE